MEELIVLLDNANNPIGSAPKLASHHANTPLHLAFSCYIFNDGGELLLTQRAATKKVWPGVWTNSVCGHPAPGEALTEAINRRSDYELGITALNQLQELIPNYRYKTPLFKGIVENEFCPVFAAKLVTPLSPNPEEVQASRWISWSNLKAEIAAQPELFSYWLKDQLPRLEKSTELKHYLLI